MTRERAVQLQKLLAKASEGLSDSDALDAPEFFDVWQPDVDYITGKRLRYGDQLVRVRQDHHSQSIYPPGIDTAALYEFIAPPGQGDSKDNPIQYSEGMEIFEGKYYAQGGVTYICTRSSGAPLYHPLSALVGIYVEIA